MRFLFHPVQSNLFARSFSTTIRSRNLAKLTIVGRLAAQPSLVPTSTGQDVVRYALATDSGPRDNKETNWWNVTSFTPEGAGRDYLLGLGKGSLVYVEGDASMKKYQTKEGEIRKALSVVQRDIRVLEKRQSLPEEDGEKRELSAEEDEET